MSQRANLPTRDQFRKQFRDAVRAGLPLEKCLDLGTTWGTGNKDKSWQAKDTFRRTFKDALDKGSTIYDSLQKATKSFQGKR